MIHTLNRPNRRYRRLSRPIGYVLHDRRLTSLVIPVCMNGELKDLHARRAERAAALDPVIYSNRPDPDWIGTVSLESVFDEVNNA